MFTGSADKDMRSVLMELSQAWPGKPVYVGCSGDFSVERLLSGTSVGPIVGNDVSLYSAALGALLTGQKFDLTIRDPSLSWMADFVDTPLRTVAHLQVFAKALPFFGVDEIYPKRMWGAFERRWPDLHAVTVKKLEASLKEVRLSEYRQLDVVEFLQQTPSDAAFICFLPAYKAGSGKQRKKLNTVFNWLPPLYTVLNPFNFERLLELVKARHSWILSRNEAVPALEEWLVARVHSAWNNKPVWIYSDQGKTKRLTTPAAVKTEPLLIPRLSEPPVSGPLAILKITQGQANTVRSEYMPPDIFPGPSDICFAVTCGGLLVGVFGIKVPSFARWCNVYLKTDITVASTVPRLSKLALAAVLSKEVQGVLCGFYGRRIDYVGTTAFTDKPVSMKYRSLFELYSREEGKLNYRARAGKWTLAEGLQWWQNQNSGK